MKYAMRNLLCLLIALCILMPAAAYARSGDSGYESGISSGEAPDKDTFEYQEVCFISGKPIVFKGTLKIKKSLKRDEVISTYTYNLKNIDRSATLTRVLSFNTEISREDNGQVIEKTSLSKRPNETIKLDNTTYRLINYDFTRTRIIDSKPAIDYYAGNLWGEKKYQIGTSSSGGTVTVEATGEFYGYDQYWGNTESAVISYIIRSEEKKGEKVDKWGGTARVSRSSTTTQQLKYYENIPDQISFSGGYVKTQYNNNIMEYGSRLPVFDNKGISTDIMRSESGSLKLESFPEQKRLAVADLRHLRGHWAEKDIKMLYGLEIFNGDGSNFRPEQYMTRAEFASAIVRAAREVPEDPDLAKKTRTSTARKRKASEAEMISPFEDVSTKSPYFEDINNAFKRGLIMGTGDKFKPSDTISVAEALSIFIRSVGLEGLSPGPSAVTSFRDNDDIPGYARESAYIAEKIGLIAGDGRGYLRPNERLTKGRAAALINRYITYMRDSIRKDYREGVVSY